MTSTLSDERFMSGGHSDKNREKFQHILIRLTQKNLKWLHFNVKKEIVMKVEDKHQGFQSLVDRI